MALSLAQQADIFNSAQATIRGTRGDLNLTEIASRLLHRFTDNDPSNFLPVLNQVRNASRSVFAARQLPPDPSARIPANLHPVDAYATEMGYRYAYRVVIVADPRDGREPVETMVVIPSDVRLSPDEIRDRAAQAFSEQNFAPKSREKMRRAGPQPDIQIYIVGIGRSR